MSPAQATPRSPCLRSRSVVTQHRPKRPRSPTMLAPLSSANSGPPPSRKRNCSPVFKMTVSSNETFPAVFLDRDGTLMRDVDYCGDPTQVEVFAGAAEALGRLKANGYKLIIVTNQSGLGRSYFTEADYRAVEKEFLRQLGEGLIDATYYCPDL